MKFSLIICTYMRPIAIVKLLKSVNKQVLYPSEILIIDGSTDDETKSSILKQNFRDLIYYKVDKENRGLTKQRNFGISRVTKDIEIVCFLDDDTILEEDYFKELINTYKQYPNAGGVGGYITNEVTWRKLLLNEKAKFNEFEIDGYVRNLGSRNVLRKKLGLLSDKAPCFMPDFANGFSVGNLPPNSMIYKAQHFMGGVSSFKKEVVDTIKFSNYFEGYGLYEDADFSIRLAKMGKLFVNTNSQLKHYHDVSGRPNQYKYGKMVLRNGWYVWRVKYPSPKFKARFKWHATSFLLTLIRFTNVLTTNKKQEALSESLGRLVGWFSLIFNKPKDVKIF